MGAILGVVLLLFAVRLVQIQGIDADDYAEAAANLRLATIEIPTVRGDITDASGRPFAMSVEVRTVFVDPAEVRADQRDEVVRELSQRFDLSAEEVAARLDARVDGQPSRYEVVQRGVSVEEWEELDALGLHGVSAERAYKRVYPEQTGAANLVGFVGTEGYGLEGLEAVLDSTLAGEAGQQQVEVGSDGTQIPMAGGLVKEPVPGRTVRLTLDMDLQWYAQQALAERAEELGAEAGNVVVMTRDGQIKAMANYPTYDPNDFASATAEQRRNGAVADAFEPGSTNKAITVAAALEEGVTTPDTVYTVPDSIRRHDLEFRDSHPHPTQRLTVNGIMATSSNVGAIQIAEELGAEKMYEYLRRFGFGQPTGLDLPGENAGILTDPQHWSGTDLPSISFGHSVSVNAVQLAGVYAIVANDGIRVEPTLVAGTVDPDGEFTAAPEPESERVISADTAADLRLMLEGTTGEMGTARQARIDGYRIGGKTGTANRINPETGTYQGGGYVSSFVGIAPVDDPELVVLVVLHNPQEEYYGGEAATPVFTDVMSFALKTMQVPPTGTEAPKLRMEE
ncbi:peptidoglycan D,D-transpeptidase FtsI family protein [Thermobifida halotolerans]